MPGVIGKYTSQGLWVVKLETTSRDSGPQVRAFLHSDGSGSVDIEDTFSVNDVLNTREEDILNGFLEDLGYAQDHGPLVPACAKFWFSHSLGTLTVFPGQLPLVAVHEVIMTAKPRREWVPYSGEWAFVLPVFPRRRQSKSTMRTWGTPQARSIFLGGGPFMLKDSKQLIVQVLKRLGYLDDDLNADEREALFCFANTLHNKHTLRKLELLPDPSDRSQDVKEKLRAAFFSYACPGQWQAFNSSDAAAEVIQHILWKEELLTESWLGCTRHEMIKPMKAYVKRYQLQPMKSFNGLACQIQHHNDESPTKRPMIQFKRGSCTSLAGQISVILVRRAMFKTLEVQLEQKRISGPMA